MRTPVDHTVSAGVILKLCPFTSTEIENTAGHTSKLKVVGDPLLLVVVEESLPSGV